MMKIDLNCDLGESFGAYKIGNDEEMMKYITSANIACGFHAGDPSIMRRTVRLALNHGVSIGAHPGLPDLYGFGRREISVTADEVYDLVVYQIGALQAFVTSEGGKMNHVKPHGALYNMCAVNQDLAESVAKAVYHVNPDLILFGLNNSTLIYEGEKVGLKTANEVFADRTYQSDGTLTPRSHPQALIESDEASINQVLQMIFEKKVTSIDQVEVPLHADTICLHGDGQHAVKFAKKITETLTSKEVVLTAYK
ncbi:5-oxoprolinase subunit PxpA [Cytobacillus sp. FJAT-54145]|uniref:5-oxoprolinase subunit A n=1 Tax=Cytobacillus spartinae TaxID=3299023 RepID=A0ABW6K7H4_9BACI